MFNYVFKAKTNEGVLISGDILADQRDVAINTLKQKDYYPLYIERENLILSFLRRNAGINWHVNVKEKAIFTQQLAVLLKAGMQLTSALDTLSKQTERKRFASVVKQLHADIEQSNSLSQAMSKYPNVFSRVYTAIVEASEESGSLAETLAVLSKQLKSQALMNSRIKSALVYPIFLLVVSGMVVVVLTTFVIPKFIELFVNANQALPLPTKILVTLTNSLKESWWLFLFAAIATVCVVSVIRRNNRIRLYVDGLLLKFPMIGTLNKKLHLARFARTLGSLLKGGVRIVSAINTTQKTTTNTVFAKEIGDIEKAIVKGSPLAKAMREQRHFSAIAANMIAVGEDTGTLPDMLLEVADIYEQEYESALSSMTNLLGPFMIVILGLIIGFVVMAILLPIFETSTMTG
jgi:type II secretory pathway component PulF